MNSMEVQHYIIELKEMNSLDTQHYKIELKENSTLYNWIEGNEFTTYSTL